MKPTKVMLAGHDAIVLAGLNCLLTKTPAVQVAGEAGNGANWSESADRWSPQVVVLDVGHSDLADLLATRRLLKAHPHLRVLVLCSRENPTLARQFLGVGAAGCLLKGASPTELEQAIHQVASGQTYLSASLARRMATHVGGVTADEAVPAATLTGRQREVLRLLAEGQNTKEIAAELRVSPKTVEFHRSRLMLRLRISSVAGLVRHAIRAGLVQL